jgi:penicillin-binding protein 2
MVGLVSAIGNGGIRYRPQILKRIENTQGEVVRSESPIEAARIEFSEKTMEFVRRGLWEAVNTVGGTAFRSRWSAVDISGKTGTAQVVGRKEDETVDDQEEVVHHHKDHAWFVAYAPSEEPKIAVAVIIEHGEHGSSAAAPIAREMIQTYLGDRSDGQKVAKME